MSASLDLVFLWHMHQPDYRDPDAMTDAGNKRDDTFVLPWVYLHALKDYADMAAHLERHPDIRAIVNFVPVLLDQIDDYNEQFASGRFRDPLLRLLARPDLDGLTTADRNLLLEACFLGNHATMLAPFRHYQRLHDLYRELAGAGPAALNYLSGAYFADLVTWYHLAWTGESVRRSEPLIAELMSKGIAYSFTDRQALLALIGRTLRDLLPRYRTLAEHGRIELSCTPQTHPLGPLLLDFNAARESQPEAPLPLSTAYPGGRSRLDAQIEAARDSHARRFGAAPCGMWPAEGALSTAFAAQLATHGCRWIASGEGVLHTSLKRAGRDDSRAACKLWRMEQAPGTTLFFRNERLSDLIGFEYAKWHGQDAARHFIAELEAIHATTPAGEQAVVSVIMDGENAWEHYPYNAYYFFEDLYALLEAHPFIRTTTYREILGRSEHPSSATLPGLVAGSWVYGTLSTWIGDDEKNRAWDLLCSAKQSYDMVMAGDRLDATERTAATARLAVCESSDWFWWFGGYNPPATVARFDRLFRRNLASLYRLLHLAPPAQLETPIARLRDDASVTAPGSGVMRRAQEPHPHPSPSHAT